MLMAIVKTVQPSVLASEVLVTDVLLGAISGHVLASQSPPCGQTREMYIPCPNGERTYNASIGGDEGVRLRHQVRWHTAWYLAHPD